MSRTSHRNSDDSSGRQRNLAARMGRWSAGHWKTATFGWLAFVVVAFALGGVVGTKTIDPNAAGPGESGRMDAILEAGFAQPAGESVLIQSRSIRVGDPAFTAAIHDVVARVSKVAAVQNVRSPLAPGNAGQIAKGRDAALVEFDIRGDADEAADKIDPVLDRVDEAQRAHPGFFIGEFGDASAAKAVDTLFADDLASAGLFSIPITLIILVVAFGALVAAGIPLLLALTAVFATFGLAALGRLIRMASVPPEGGCACGAIRYRLTSDPLFIHCCHCLNCQRQTGSAFVVNLLIEADRVELLAGAPQRVDVPRDDGSAQRIFRCPTCQVAVFSEYGRPEVRFVRGGTLDHPSRVSPDVHIYTRSKVRWVTLPDSVPAFEAYYDTKALWPAESLHRLRAVLAPPVSGA